MEAEIRQPQYLPWQAELLQQALSLKAQQRLPHAVLIEAGSDQDMSGFIWQLSMLLLCETPEASDFCGHCKACQMMLGNTYADFRFVTLEYNDKTKKINKNINIEQTRNLIHEVFLTRRYAALKIAAIYPAEKLNNASANSLLKTLEEPADEVLLILVTHNLGRIPVTLRSRCQTWSIRKARPPEASSWLQRQGVDDAEAARHLEYANGDPVLALQLIEQGYAPMLEQFKQQFSRYLRGETSVSGLSNSLTSFEPGSVRRLINTMLTAYCYQFSGVNARAGANPASAQAVLRLQLQAQKQLLIEENNLDLQLQLEDVLISLKQIIVRRTD